MTATPNSEFEGLGTIQQIADELRELDPIERAVVIIARLPFRLCLARFVALRPPVVDMVVVLALDAAIGIAGGAIVRVALVRNDRTRNTHERGEHEEHGTCNRTQLSIHPIQLPPF